MTGTREPQQDGSIQAMLRDSGLEAATELRNTLEQLEGLVPGQAPAPRADLAAMLAAGSVDHEAGALPAAVADLAERRRGNKRRLAVVGGAVVGAMALGAGAVAASGGDFRDGVHRTVGVIFQNPGATSDVAPEHAPPGPSDLPAAPAPVPASPEAPVPASPEAPDPAAGSRSGGPGQGTASPAASEPGTMRKAVGRGGVLPAPSQRPLTPAVPGTGAGRSLPAHPLPELTMPGVVPGKFPGQP